MPSRWDFDTSQVEARDELGKALTQARYPGADPVSEATFRARQDDLRARATTLMDSGIPTRILEWAGPRKVWDEAPSGDPRRLGYHHARRVRTVVRALRGEIAAVEAAQSLDEAVPWCEQWAAEHPVTRG